MRNRAGKGRMAGRIKAGQRGQGRAERGQADTRLSS